MLGHCDEEQVVPGVLGERALRKHGHQPGMDLWAEACSPGLRLPLSAMSPSAAHQARSLSGHCPPPAHAAASWPGSSLSHRCRPHDARAPSAGGLCQEGGPLPEGPGAAGGDTAGMSRSLVSLTPA